MSTCVRLGERHLWFSVGLYSRCGKNYYCTRTTRYSPPHRYVSFDWNILTLHVIVVILFKAMPPAQFISSLSTKTINLDRRHDIQIISIDPNQPIPHSRIVLGCEAVGVGMVTFQIQDAGAVWHGLHHMPPYVVFNLGPAHHPDLLIPTLPVVAIEGDFAHLIDWVNNWRLVITAPHLRFAYHNLPHNPILFSELHLVQQTQASLLAEQVEW